jgi:6-phosphogluconolactonase (cycloisomerase 2 family)
VAALGKRSDCASALLDSLFFMEDVFLRRNQMKVQSHFLWALSAALTLTLTATSFADDQDFRDRHHHYLIANNDNSQGNSASFYTVSKDGSLTEAAVVPTGGLGLDGIGAVVTRRVNVLADERDDCAFVSNGGSSNIAAISIRRLKFLGTFPGSVTDVGTQWNIGLANNGRFLYASFAASKTIATFRILSGCRLRFLGDVPAVGLNGGEMLSMAVHRDILVGSFDDGSIGSFNLAHGVPVSNGDLEITTAHSEDSNPIGGVDISSDGHFAVVGNVFNPLVEVSDISSGKLTPTVVYRNIGTGSDTNFVSFSPNGKWLYIGNFFSGQVTAALFNRLTGEVSGGCTSNFLSGNNFTSEIATATEHGTGSTLYVSEADRNIGVVDIDVSAGTCSLSEQMGSPVNDPNTETLESIASFPPRAF